MTIFIGRDREFRELTHEFAVDRPSLVVLSGRRRIGKSRLIEEFARSHTFYKFTGLAPYKEMTAQVQRDEFARKLEEQFNLYPVKSDDWATLFTVLAKQVGQQQAIILLDEISWLAYKDHSFLSKLKNTWDDYFSKNSKLMLVLCGSVSSWIEENILSSTAYLGRPSWIIRLDELPLDQCNKFWIGDNISAYEKLKVLAITGGVPRYLELIDPIQTAEQNIQRLCFNTNGPLYKEFNNIFSDIYGEKNDKYQLIVQILTDGPKSRDEISKSTGIQNAGNLTKYLTDLELGGFIKRDYTWSINTGKQSKLSKFRIKDNYARFYLKYVLPNAVNIENNIFSDTSLSSLRGWYSIMGLQFENLVCNNLDILIKKLGIAKQDVVIANPYFQRKTTRQQTLQIDYMIQIKQSVLYVFEIKFSSKPVDMSVIDEMKEKIKKLALPKNVSLRLVLVHVNGVSDKLFDEKYFHHIIDFSELLTNNNTRV